MNGLTICDAHADTLWRLACEPDAQLDLSLPRLRAGGVALQVMAMFVGMDSAPEQVSALFERMLAARDALVAAGWQFTDKPAEARPGQTRFMLSIEGCEPFESGLHTIDAYRALGVRMAAPTWNYQNKLGTPACVNQDDGLTAYGLAAVQHMQALGIAVDVSHLNIPGFYDILHKTDKPPLASHSCCRALCDHSRNLSDRQLIDLFATGGYVGVNFFPLFLAGEGKPCTIDTVVDHIDHMHHLGGAGMVGFGSDFDGISKKPVGLDNPADFPALIDRLRQRGYTDEQVRDIAGLSFIRYFERIS